MNLRLLRRGATQPTERHESRSARSPHGRTESGLANRLRRYKGFTLVEMLIVVLLIGILVAIAAPRFRSSRDDYRARLAAWRLAGDLHSVSALALAQGRSIPIHFLNSGPNGTSRYWIEGVQHPVLRASLIDVTLSDEPYEVNLSNAPARIAYDMYGMPDGDYDLVLTSPNGKTWQVRVRRDSSRVEVVNGQ